MHSFPLLLTFTMFFRVMFHIKRSSLCFFLANAKNDNRKGDELNAGCGCHRTILRPPAIAARENIHTQIFPTGLLNRLTLRTWCLHDATERWSTFKATFSFQHLAHLHKPADNVHEIMLADAECRENNFWNTWVIPSAQICKRQRRILDYMCLLVFFRRTYLENGGKF